ncbi:MAG: alpha/beta fold hydrolase [Pseudomonadota bacterium]
MTHFIRSGHGPEDGLLLHCMLADARALDGMCAKLAGHLTSLSMDLPGHGQSEDWDRARDFGDMTCYMALGLLDRPAHVIGHSYGGYAALRLAVDHPEMVRSLTLIEPVFFAAAKHGDPVAFKAYEKAARPMVGAISVGDLTSAARSFTGQWGTGRPWESLKPAEMDYITQRMPLVAATDAGLRRDTGKVYDRLTELQIPTLIIRGAQSPEIMKVICETLAGQIPAAEYRTVEDAGHMVAVTRPADVADLIATFIDAQPRSSDIS